MRKLNQSARIFLFLAIAVLTPGAKLWAGRNAQFIEQVVPSKMEAGKVYEVKVVMRNTGDVAWGLNYSLHSQNSADNMTWGKNREGLSGVVYPNNNVQFVFTVTAPATPGPYNFQWQMHMQDVGWFGQSSPNVAVDVVACPFEGNDASFDSQSFGSQSVGNIKTGTGQPQTVSVTMCNRGSSTWSKQCGFQLGSYNTPDNMIWGINRVPLSNSVEPNSCLQHKFSITTPATVGAYQFQWRMLQGADWFGKPSENKEVSVEPPADNAGFISQEVPTEMVSGQTYPVKIVMRRSGNTAWSKGTYALGAQNSADNMTWGLNRVPLDNDNDAVFNFKVTAPLVAGDYNFSWQMRHEGVGWFGSVSKNVVVKVRLPADQAVFVGQGVPRDMVIGETYAVSIGMNYTGDKTDARPDLIKLGSQNQANNTTWGLNRVKLPTGTSKSKTFNFDVKAPAAEGTYNFSWQMLRENAGQFWFGDVTPNVEVKVRPRTNAARFISQDVPEVMRPGQTYSVSVTMQNSGNTLWTDKDGFQLVALVTPWPATVKLSSVLSGDLKTFTFQVTAPTAPGVYNFSYRMSHNGAGFGDASQNAAIKVEPSTGPNALTVMNEGLRANWASQRATFTAPIQKAIDEQFAQMKANDDNFEHMQSSLDFNSPPIFTRFDQTGITLRLPESSWGIAVQGKYRVGGTWSHGVGWYVTLKNLQVGMAFNSTLDPATNTYVLQPAEPVITAEVVVDSGNEIYKWASILGLFGFIDFNPNGDLRVKINAAIKKFLADPEFTAKYLQPFNFPVAPKIETNSIAVDRPYRTYAVDDQATIQWDYLASAAKVTPRLEIKDMNGKARHSFAPKTGAFKWKVDVAPGVYEIVGTLTLEQSAVPPFKSYKSENSVRTYISVVKTTAEQPQAELADKLRQNINIALSNNWDQEKPNFEKSAKAYLQNLMDETKASFQSTPTLTLKTLTYEALDLNAPPLFGVFNSSAVGMSFPGGGASWGFKVKAQADYNFQNLLKGTLNINVSAKLRAAVLAKIARTEGGGLSVSDMVLTDLVPDFKATVGGASITETFLETLLNNTLADQLIAKSLSANPELQKTILDKFKASSDKWLEPLSWPPPPVVSKNSLSLVSSPDGLYTPNMKAKLKWAYAASADKVTARLLIKDISGKTVREFAPAPTSGATTEWDLKDGSNVKVVPGVYEIVGTLAMSQSGGPSIKPYQFEDSTRAYLVVLKTAAEKTSAENQDNFRQALNAERAQKWALEKTARTESLRASAQLQADGAKAAIKSSANPYLTLKDLELKVSDVNIDAPPALAMLTPSAIAVSFPAGGDTWRFTLTATVPYNYQNIFTGTLNVKLAASVRAAALAVMSTSNGAVSVSDLVLSDLAPDLKLAVDASSLSGTLIEELLSNVLAHQIRANLSALSSTFQEDIRKQVKALADKGALPTWPPPVTVSKNEISVDRFYRAYVLGDTAAIQWDYVSSATGKDAVRKLEIKDLDGKIVRTFDTASTTTNWNLKNESKADVAPGVYEVAGTLSISQNPGPPFAPYQADHLVRTYISVVKKAADKPAAEKMDKLRRILNTQLADETWVALKPDLLAQTKTYAAQFAADLGKTNLATPCRSAGSACTPYFSNLQIAKLKPEDFNLEAAPQFELISPSGVALAFPGTDAWSFKLGVSVDYNVSDALKETLKFNFTAALRAAGRANLKLTPTSAEIVSITMTDATPKLNLQMTADAFAGQFIEALLNNVIAHQLAAATLSSNSAFQTVLKARLETLTTGNMGLIKSLDAGKLLDGLLPPEPAPAPPVPPADAPAGCVPLLSMTANDTCALGIPDVRPEIDALLAELGTKKPVSSGSFDWPMGGPILHRFGCTPFPFEPKDANCSSGHTHFGADIQGGDVDVKAADGGIAYPFLSAGMGYGNHVIIIHKDWVSVYSHLKSASVANGTVVVKGAKIGISGDTGVQPAPPHLHWELRPRTDLKPIDPLTKITTRMPPFAPLAPYIPDIGKALACIDQAGISGIGAAAADVAKQLAAGTITVPGQTLETSAFVSCSSEKDSAIKSLELIPGAPEKTMMDTISCAGARKDLMGLPVIAPPLNYSWNFTSNKEPGTVANDPKTGIFFYDPFLIRLMSLADAGEPLWQKLAISTSAFTLAESSAMICGFDPAALTKAIAEGKTLEQNMKFYFSFPKGVRTSTPFAWKQWVYAGKDESGRHIRGPYNLKERSFREGTFASSLANMSIVVPLRLVKDAEKITLTRAGEPEAQVGEMKAAVTGLGSLLGKDMDKLVESQINGQLAAQRESVASSMAEQTKKALDLKLPYVYSLAGPGTAGETVNVIVAAYPFDDGNTTRATDVSGLNHGVIFGATPASALIGKGLLFDGVDDYVEVPDSLSLRSLVESGEVSLLFKKPSISPVSAVLIAKAQADLSKPQFALSVKDGKLIGSLGNGTAVKSVSASLSAFLAGPGDWLHTTLAWRNSGAELKLYVGGMMMASDLSPFTAQANTSPLTFGGAGLKALPYKGMLDGILIKKEPTIAPLALERLPVSVSGNSALIEWGTGIAADAFISYQKALSTSWLVKSSVSQKLLHSLTLTGLTASTKYYFVASSRSDNNLMISPVLGFTTGAKGAGMAVAAAGSGYSALSAEQAAQAKRQGLTPIEQAGSPQAAEADLLAPEIAAAFEALVVREYGALEAPPSALRFDYNPNALPPSLAPAQLKLYRWESKARLWSAVPEASHDMAEHAFHVQTNKSGDMQIFAPASGEGVSAVAADLGGLKVFPNPLLKSGGSQDATGFTFSGLTRQAKVQVFTVTGEAVRTLEKDDNSDLLFWDTRNASGSPVASGTYLYLVTNAQGEKKKGRVALAR